MVYPEDEERRSRWLAVHSVGMLTEGVEPDQEVRVHARILRLVLDAPSSSERRAETVELTKRGMIAGWILASLYVMNRFDLAPSMNRALWCAYKFASEQKFGDGSSIQRSEPTIRKFWKEFQPVAHFWAAAELNRSYPFADERGLFGDDFTRFLGVAAGLLRFGTTWVNDVAREKQPPVDRARAWSLPTSVEPLNLVATTVPDRLVRYLSDYKAPMSY
jgi:hypothetical protein